MTNRTKIEDLEKLRQEYVTKIDAFHANETKTQPDYSEDKTFDIKVKASEFELILEALDEKADCCHDAGEVLAIQQVNRLWNKLDAEQSKVTVQQQHQAEIARLGAQFMARQKGIDRGHEGFSR